MKIATKFSSAGLAFIVAVGLTSISFAESKALLSVSSENSRAGGSIAAVSRADLLNRGSSFVVDFVEGPTEVVALQFDLIVETKGGNVDIRQCGSGLPSSHFANCVIRSDGSVRVLVESATNAALITSNIGRISVSGPAKVSFKEGSIVLSDITAASVDFDSL
mgnify:CR=1 FL=1